MDKVVEVAIERLQDLFPRQGISKNTSTEKLENLASLNNPKYRKLSESQRAYVWQYVLFIKRIRAEDAERAARKRRGQSHSRYKACK